jgi:hypothetical protein
MNHYRKPTDNTSREQAQPNIQQKFPDVFRRTAVVNIRKLNLHFANTCQVSSNNNSNNKLLCKSLRVVVSPLKLPERHTKRRGLFPNIFKCNSRTCMCCSFLQTSHVINSSINRRNFNCSLNEDIS